MKSRDSHSQTVEADEASAVLRSGTQGHRVLALHVDRGGTFTDVVEVLEPLSDTHGLAIAPRRLLRFSKVPSDRAVVGRLAGTATLTVGTTVATNALLERKGVPTLLLVSAGFEDLTRLRDMRRPDLFDPDQDWPPSLATAVVGVDADGHDLSIQSLDLHRFRAVAIALTGTEDDAEHERRLGERLLEAAPHLHVALGHSISPEPGYLARIETTLVDAAITPHLMAHLNHDEIPADALAVRSDAGLVPAYDLRAPDAILSGPAPGVLAVLEVARLAGFAGAVGLDMGGTSTDVCLVTTQDGPRRREGELEVAGVRLSRTMLEIDTIAAGGGSILQSDGVRLAVGPRSAGANPGPQCYGRGGPPTLTDAALIAGLIDPAHFPIPLHSEAVDLPTHGADAGEAALRFLDVARETMAQAITRLAMSRGIALKRTSDTADALADDNRMALVAYGGAGGQHAAFVADKLSLDTVLVHPAAPVFCAFGQLLATRSETAKTSLWTPLEALMADDGAALQAAKEALVGELLARFEGAATPPTLGFELVCVLRGTDGLLVVDLVAGDDLAALEHRLAAAQMSRFGFVRDLPIEVRALFGTATATGSGHSLDDYSLDVRTLGLAPGESVVGPTVVHGQHTSIAVPAGWRARADDHLVWVERASTAAPAEPSTVTDPSTVDDAYSVAIWQARLTAIAEEGGAILQRLAQSVSIKERLDFSCALFDPAGHLVVNAPHIPVHLGAMGDTVRDVAAFHPADSTHDGDSWLTNDPAAGGSHLPDLTVITAIHHEGLRFFCASRAHHVDVGGISPGSMPSRSTTLAEEGLAVRRVPLVRSGELLDLHTIVTTSRQPAVVVADLLAQLAANAHMARRLRSLAPASHLVARMRALGDSATASTRAWLKSSFEPFTTLESVDDLDGISLHLRMTHTLSGDGVHGLTLDFGACNQVHPGNLNAPSAVVRAAVLYALRLAITARDASSSLAPTFPVMNDGTLVPVEILTHHPSMLNPPDGVAIVGGNVETSQRIVDLVLTALGIRAASAGSMSNLVIGGQLASGDHWSFYETLGGGYGSTPTRAGTSARQTHMTNTRATDPEVLNRRLPLRVVRFAIRPDSGGPGLHRGGDGLIRELEVKAPCIVSLLAAWRPAGAPGLCGGQPGAPGRAFVRRGSLARWSPWDGEPTPLEPGDRIRVETPGGGGWGAPNTSLSLQSSNSSIKVNP